jgi:hypothetical protein
MQAGLEKRAWQGPALFILPFRQTAGTQQSGADNPQVASFGNPTPLPSFSLPFTSFPSISIPICNKSGDHIDAFQSGCSS